MKRAFLRKVKPVSCSPRESAGQPEQAPSGVHRKAVAMFGLALSVGATSLVLPHHEDGASAAEASGAETSAASVSQVAALPQSAGTAEVAKITVVEHVVREGQTLAQIARSYRVSIGAITRASQITADAALKPGQVLQIPVANLTTGKADAAGLVASAELNQVSMQPVAQDTGSATAEREAALSRLRQQREKLRESLAELRFEEINRSAETSKAAMPEVAAPASTAAPVAPSTISSLITTPPRVDPSQTIAASQLPQKSEAVSYRVQPGDTLTAIARTHGVSEQQLLATNHLPDPDWIRVSQSLNIPSPQAAPKAAVQASQQQPVDAQVVEAQTAQSPAQQFQIAQAAPAVQPSAQPAVPAEVAVAAGMEEYQVGPGDTLAKIARAHNIPQTTLLNANRISDPNVIFVGQTLRVPSVRPTVPVVPVVQPVAVAPETIAPVERQVNPVQPAAEQLEMPSAPAAQPTTNNASYVENLLAEVRALREKHQGNLGAGGAAPQPSVAQQETPARAEQLATVNRTNPITQAPANQRDSQPDLVATAPLGSESYAPLRQPLTGRTVSPDLPPLPGAEAYLPETSRSQGMIWPAKGMLSSGYGWRWGRMHQGIDIAADVGTPIYAAADGVVEFSDWNSGGYGNLVEVRHADGSLTRYAHLNRSLVQAGQRVRQGEQIAEMGSTGYSTGPHLHFEVHPAGQGAVNPIAYLPQ
ncbi:LysM peptidoglycan-binding domain-containing protein [Phormidium tenue FACHB-886]|nr:LysM peptidoglycan-binding domain-containing protein [Phormidium tenue FACHB-886]